VGREGSEEREWWSVLEVSPYASANEIRRSYLRKIKQSIPDRVLSLAPELLSLADGRAKALNAAYATAIRCRKQSRKFGSFWESG
jgi:DnaJ-domain-containing protein 1